MKLSKESKFIINHNDGSGPAGRLEYSLGKLCFIPKYPVSVEEMESVIKIIKKIEKEWEVKQ